MSAHRWRKEPTRVRRADSALRNRRGGNTRRLTATPIALPTRTSSTIWPSWESRSTVPEADTYVAKAKNAAVATWVPYWPRARHCPTPRATSATRTNVRRSGPAVSADTAWRATPRTMAPTKRRDCTTDW
ncbi:hypothetical protein GCM10009551_056290 [Nocardiopsis tropica]